MKKTRRAGGEVKDGRLVFLILYLSLSHLLLNVLFCGENEMGK
jgi:hypothetical protein